MSKHSSNKSKNSSTISKPKPAKKSGISKMLEKRATGKSNPSALKKRIKKMRDEW